jgi:hypothetical protein
VTERETDVVEVEIEAVEPAELIGAEQRRGGPFDKADVDRRVPRS